MNDYIDVLQARIAELERLLDEAREDAKGTWLRVREISKTVEHLEMDLLSALQQEQAEVPHE